MSEVKIQTTPAPQGSNDLQPDTSDERSRKGFAGSQVFPITGATGVEVNTTSGASSNGGLSVGGATVNVKPVGFKTLEGSTPGDHRTPSRDTAKDSLFKAADNGAPRSAVGQTPLSGTQSS